MSRMRGLVLLVGSVPLPTVTDVFRTCARELGPFLSAYPDGEVGERKYWIFYLPKRTYSGHPDLEEVSGPESGDVIAPAPGSSEDEIDKTWWTFRLRDGVTSVSFHDLHYADTAAGSYEIFQRLRKEGEIPAKARFQVSLPTTAAAIMPFFVRPDQWPVLYDAYRSAIFREIDRVLEAIPRHDLVIQWDIATEVRDILAGDQPLLPWSPPLTAAEKWECHLEDMGLMSRNIPEEVLLGYHFCFGTWGGWPHSRAPDSGVCVRLSNEAVARAGRTVDYVHIPVMPDASDAFFEPMRELSLGETKIYVGIALEDGVQAFDRRLAAVRRHLSNFGIASYCGWGRRQPAELPGILADLRACAEHLAMTGTPA